MGSSLVLRRSQEGQSVLLHLLLTHKIVTVTATALTEFLKHNGVTLRALSTKTAKIRALLRIPFIAERVPDDCKEALDSKLQKLDAKRQSKPDQLNPDDEDDDEENEAGICKLEITPHKIGPLNRVCEPTSLNNQLTCCCSLSCGYAAAHMFGPLLFTSSRRSKRRTRKQTPVYKLLLISLQT